MTKMSLKRRSKRALRRFAKIVRIISVAPVPAACLFVLMYTYGRMNSIAELVCGILTISLLPLTAYPLQNLIPHFKSKGREGQRTLAMIMSTAGYVLAVSASIVLEFSESSRAVFLTYLLSGVTLLIINKLFKFRASGHACGLAGPMGVIAYLIGPAGFAISGAVLLLVLWSSLKLRSHTAPQFIVGALIPNIIFFTLILL